MFEKNNCDLYLTIKDLISLEEVNIDQKSAKLFSEKHGIVAFALVSNETIADQSHIHMRCFAPAVGIPEDPFTGSVLGGLATYIQLTNLIPKNLKIVRVEQGHFISRPGYVDLKLAGTNQPPLVFAKARHFFSTKIEL
jgi:PhzF family phenazine biosynthesis protein